MKKQTLHEMLEEAVNICKNSEYSPERCFLNRDSELKCSNMGIEVIGYKKIGDDFFHYTYIKCNRK